jgi:hypothetical protein
VDWDWDLIVALATLLVAASAVVLILIEAGARRRAQGLPIDPRPRWRAVGPPTAGVLPIEVSNTGAAATSCCVVMHVGEFLYAGNFPLAEQQSWAPQSLEVFDTVDRTAGANSLFCVARNLAGLWWAVAPQRVISAMPDSAVPFEVCRLLRKTTGRTYTCSLETDGKLAITPMSPSTRASVETAS